MISEWMMRELQQLAYNLELMLILDKEPSNTVEVIWFNRINIIYKVPYLWITKIACVYHFGYSLYHERK